MEYQVGGVRILATSTAAGGVDDHLVMSPIPVSRMVVLLKW